MNRGEAIRRVIESVQPIYTAEQIRATLWGLIRDPRHPDQPAEFDTQAQLADSIGVSAQYLNMVLRGKKNPNGKVLAYLGIERVVTYRKSIA